MVLTDGELIVTIIRNVDGITHGLDVGPDMGSLDGSFYSSYDDKLEV